jgi:hypothetical protein
MRWKATWAKRLVFLRLLSPFRLLFLVNYPEDRFPLSGDGRKIR